ncbi:hypothetical protein SODALDRAFT_66296 [Sodiomyces alkalinus F11]|uniref:mannan endo-1,6-alpha-mannosidase n=1 Tax=Sodiomyces alkalinus (strain CBS 110278 / VKM F-3762 / F11) TaxID=1314773 RepID=A0A3N2PM82_SODAK|nr:hypothetical protein SODALDRAFT_66296 [Sodiomyces alkalinus F11]ROT35446.1 hypothetical protein SODALDRAFT_66296 [Sodiomyces alkalinus F11]
MHSTQIMISLWGQPRCFLSRLLAVLLLVANNGFTVAYDLDPSSPDSVRSVSRSIAEDLMSLYHGHRPGQTPGLLPDPPYYWWEAGALMGAMIDYWYYTGDGQWNDRVIQGLMHQVGDNADYMPKNQTLTEGNDDQGFWGLAVMSAAEQRFPDPPEGQPHYLALAQAVFNTQAARWDTEHCGGGLRWQIFTWNKGFDYKNTISQGCFFALAARLALYTGNSSYTDWAERAWDWTVAIQFIDSATYRVFDGAHTTTNCTNIIPYQWSYNAGVFINGASAMYNLTGSQVWRERLDGLVAAADVFFVGPNKDIMQEVACETVQLCDIDQQSFKAYLSRWLAATTKWAPHLADHIMPKLRASSIAAASTCVGGDNGRMCGLRWTEEGKWDGIQGVGPQMMAMQVTLANLVASRPDAVTMRTGGTSQGDPAAGSADIGRTEPEGMELAAITTKDRVGAAILTTLIVMGLVAILIWLFLDETSEKPVKQRFFEFRKQVTSTRGLAAAFSLGGRVFEADEKGKGPELPSSGAASDEDAAVRAPPRSASGVVAPLPVAREMQSESHQVPVPIRERRASVIQVEASGSGSRSTSNDDPATSQATTKVQRFAKRLNMRDRGRTGP